MWEQVRSSGREQARHLDLPPHPDFSKVMKYSVATGMESSADGRMCGCKMHRSSHGGLATLLCIVVVSTL